MNITIYSNDTSIDWNATGAERIVQNVKNIIRTKQYEVPFIRGLGVNPDFIDERKETIKADIATHIEEVISTYEERATVLSVDIESCDENGEYIIAVELEV